MKKSIFLFFAAILCAMSVQSANTMRIYCKQAQSWWKSDGAAVGAHYWGTAGDGTSWPGKRMTKVSGQTDLWYIDVDIDKYQKIIFTRVNGSGSVSDWGAKTGDLTIANTTNQYTISSSSAVWGDPGVKGSWGTYKPTSTVALATSATDIFVGGQATLTPSLTSNTSANTIKETAYAISPAGANVSDNTFTATAEGTYTITATVTYYPLGCPTLTSTATATTTIVAEIPAEETHDVTISYMCGSTKVADPTTVNTVGVETPVKVTAPEIAKYTFANWTLGADVATTDALTSNEINITTKAGGSDFTLVANYEKAKLTYTVTVPAGTENCYLVGAMNGWDVENPIEMTKQGENVFTTTLEGVATTDEYKYISQKGSWDYADVQDANRTWTANDVVTAWKDPLATGLYLRGSMNGWGTTDHLKKATKDATTATVTIALEANTDYTLKVAKSDWSEEYGTGSFAATATVKLTSKGSDVSLKTTTAGDYVFTWEMSTKKLTVTYPTLYAVTATANDAAMGTIAGAGEYGKGSTATLTATPNDGYLFVNWTKGGEVVATTQEYSFKVTEAVALVANFEAAPEEVHNVTVSYVCGGNKIADDQTVAAVGETTAKTVEAPAIFGYTFASWTLGAGVTSTNELTSNTIDINIVAGGSDYTLTANYTEIPKVKIYVVNNKKWSKVNVYGWKDGEAQGTPGWPGQEITANLETEKVAGFDVYSYSVVPGSYDNLILNNGSDKTEDYKWTDGKYYYVGAAKNYAGGTAEEVEKALVDVYTIMGASELGLSWDLTKTGNDMTKQTDGTYTLVKEGLDLATTGNYEYKVVKNHSWDWSIPSGNTNQTLKVDKDGTYTVTFTLSADKKKLTADALCTAEKEVILDCSVAGTINLVGGTADFTDKLAMTYDEGTKTYSKTFTALAAGNYQMKVVYGSDWLGYDKLTKPVPANVTEGDDKKIKFSLAEAGDVTVTYNVEKGIGLDGTFAVPETKYYIAGTENLTGFNWKENGLEMTKDDDVYKYTFSEVNAGIYEFKITDGTWTKTWGFSNLAKNYVGVSQGVDGEGNPNGNIKITTEEAKNIIVIFDPANNKITLDGWEEPTPEVYTRTVTEGNYGTICLPYASSNYSGATFFKIAYKETGKVYIDEVTTLEAGVPYIFQATSTEIAVEYEGEEKVATNHNGLYGTFTEIADVANVHTDKDEYILTGGLIRKCESNCKVPANRAYIVLDEISTEKTPAPVNRRRVGMAVNSENTETGLDNIINGKNTTIKVIENGQLIIIRNGEKFNAQGQKL